MMEAGRPTSGATGMASGGNSTGSDNAGTMTNTTRAGDSAGRPEAIIKLGTRREPGIPTRIYEYQLTLAYETGRPWADVQRRRVRRRGPDAWERGPVPSEVNVMVNVALAVLEVARQAHNPQSS